MDRRVKELQSIMPIMNIPSVLKHGILSYERASKLKHADVSMHEVQERRDRVQVPGGLRLHRYANVYFHARNPMMYKRRDRLNSLCVLQVSLEILEFENTIITDQNGSSDYVRFLTPADHELLDFDKIFAQDWRHPDDPIEYWRHKSIKCAEVLVPNCIEPRYILGAYVANSDAKILLEDQEFIMSVTINPDLFFAA